MKQYSHYMCDTSICTKGVIEKKWSKAISIVQKREECWRAYMNPCLHVNSLKNKQKKDIVYGSIFNFIVNIFFLI